MTANTIFRKISLTLSTLGLSLALVACGGSGGGGTLDAAKKPSEKPPTSQAPEPKNPPASSEPGTGTEPNDEHETPIAENTPPKIVDGLVKLQWQRPIDREDGEYLELDEIGGYELRYKADGDTKEHSVIIDGAADSYQLSGLKGKYWFEIAAFDSNGLYSQFVTLTPYN